MKGSAVVSLQLIYRVDAFLYNKNGTTDVLPYNTSGISDRCGQSIKICKQQCEVGPPCSISTHRLGVWFSQARVPFCLKPRQTMWVNHNVKVERLSTQTSFSVWFVILFLLLCLTRLKKTTAQWKWAEYKK